MSRSPHLLPPRRGGLPSGRPAQILHTLPGLYYETTPWQTVTVHRECALLLVPDRKSLTQDRALDTLDLSQAR
jgi:hypothetical protein